MVDPIVLAPNAVVRQLQQQVAKAPSEIVKNVVITFLAGVAIVLGLLLITYCVMIVMDQYCCCLPGFRPPGEAVEIDHGPVARKAGLWGLRQEERNTILEQILKGKPYSPGMIQRDEENCIQKNTTEETNAAKDDDNPNDTLAPINALDVKMDVTKEEQNENDEEDLDDLNHDVICAICLSEYGTHLLCAAQVMMLLARKHNFSR